MKKRLIVFLMMGFIVAGCSISQNARQTALPIVQTNWELLRPYAGAETATMDVLVRSGDRNLPLAWAEVRDNVTTKLRSELERGVIDTYLFDSKMEGVRLMDRTVELYGNQ